MRKVIFDIFHLGMDKSLHIGAIIVISSLLLQSIILLALYFFFVRKKRTMYIAWKYRIAFIIWEISIFAIHLLPYSPNLSNSEHFRYMEYELGVIVPFVGLVMPFLFVTVEISFRIRRALGNGCGTAGENRSAKNTEHKPHRRIIYTFSTQKY